MKWPVILRILGILITLFSVTNLPAIGVAWIYDEPEAGLFFYSFVINLITGLLLWIPFYNYKYSLRSRDGFLITTLFWVVLCMFGALPLMLARLPELSFTDAIFESMSGLTTTGATILTNIDILPKSILYYRQQLQWFGGMGIIVLAVAILPLLGIGGMQLYRTETPGPIKDQKLTPRIAETAKTLWYLYFVITVACAFSYWAMGMDVFDAIGHSFATVATGGLSTHDASIGFFNNPKIEFVSIFFMLIAGISFALHYMSWNNKSLSGYLADTETRSYILMLVAAVCLAVPVLVDFNLYDLDDAFRISLFEVVSVTTTTGFSVADFSVWPLFLPIMLLFLGFAGGCAGSTSGGMKVVRIVMMFKQGFRELKRLVHPSGVFAIKLNNKIIDERTTQAVWGFFSAYMFMFIVLYLLLLGFGLDIVTAFSTLASCINNLGPALGDATNHYQSLPDSAKWVLSFAMLLGRLETFTLLVLFTPAFWRS